jgi:hypothetical protein
MYTASVIMDSSKASSILLELNSELLDDKDTYAPTATSTSLGLLDMESCERCNLTSLATPEQSKP